MCPLSDCIIDSHAAVNQASDVRKWAGAEWQLWSRRGTSGTAFETPSRCVNLDQRMITRRAEKTAIFKGSFEIWAAPKRDLKDPQARQGEARRGKVLTGIRGAAVRFGGQAALKLRVRQNRSGASEQLPMIAAGHWPQAHGKADDEWPEERVAKVRNRIRPAHAISQVIHSLIGQLGHDDKCERNKGAQRPTANKPNDHQDGQTGVNVKNRVRKPGSVSNP